MVLRGHWPVQRNTREMSRKNFIQKPLETQSFRVRELHSTEHLTPLSLPGAPGAGFYVPWASPAQVCPRILFSKPGQTENLCCALSQPHPLHVSPCSHSLCWPGKPKTSSTPCQSHRRADPSAPHFTAPPCTSGVPRERVMPKVKLLPYKLRFNIILIPVRLLIYTFK